MSAVAPVWLAIDAAVWDRHRCRAGRVQAVHPTHVVLRPDGGGQIWAAPVSDLERRPADPTRTTEGGG
jgi:hypothetical protein